MDGRTITGLVALLLGACAVPAALWFSTTERHVAAAAQQLLPQLTPDDLVVIDGRLSTLRPDPGGLIRPFAPYAAVVLGPDDARPDLSTFPQRRFFLVGESLQPKDLGLEGGTRIGAGITSVEAAAQGTPLVAMMDRLRISTEQQGVVRECRARHNSGGVRCGNQPWQYVGPSVVRANGRQVACLWMHPVHQHQLHIDVPTQGRARLWLQFADEAMNDRPHPPIVFTARAGDHELQSVACTNQQPGRCELDVTVPVAPLRLSIETQDAARQVACVGGVVEAP